MAENTVDTRSWPDLAIGLYDRLTGRGAEIEYEFNNLELSVPSAVGAQADHAKWMIKGMVKIRTRDTAKH